MSTLAPWPLVGECHSQHIAGHSCPQCDGSHEHVWVAWHDAPTNEAGGSVVPYGDGIDGYVSGPGIPVRCKTCGGRKCDVASCLLRRHHGGDHEHY